MRPFGLGVGLVTEWLLLGLGGAVGTVLRRAVGLLAARFIPVPLPVGTLTVNVLGSFALGLLFYAAAGRSLGGTDARLILGTGVMGGFTTYSSFNLETLLMFQEGHVARAFAYVALTVLACFVGGAAGLALGRAL